MTDAKRLEVLKEIKARYPYATMGDIEVFLDMMTDLHEVDALRLAARFGWFFLGRRSRKDVNG